MLANTLNTNEVKGSAGGEIEFTRLSSNGRTTEFAKVGEPLAAPHRLFIKHTETGSGLNRVRRSVVGFTRTVESDVDASVQVADSVALTLVGHVGAQMTTANLVELLANLLSFVATTGAGTTVLLDGTGNGAKALLEGSL